MKTLLLFAFLIPQFTFAATTPCKARAMRAAMSIYLEGGPYQGDQPDVSHKLLSKDGNRLTHGVRIDGGNEDGEYWSAFFKIVTDTEQNCRVLSAKAVKKF